MSFSIKKTISLAKFGWEDCVVELKSTPYKELRQLISKYSNADLKDPSAEKEAIEFFKSKFVSGQAIDDDGKKVSFTVDQIEDLPAEVVIYCIQNLISGDQDPNSSGR